MRPAWLPNEPVLSIHSPRHGRPRSAASESPSPAIPLSNSPPRDAMVLSARQLLHEPSSPRHPTDTDSTEAFVSLREFMDSFPLVPLAIIPRLRLVDLLECETGLYALYKTLAIDTNADDAQLAKYITRQLGLVQRHMEQARAKERVLQLLRGETPTALAPITRLHTTSAKALPVFLQSVSPAHAHATSTGNGNGKPPPPVLTTTKSASSLAVKKADTTSQLTKAKAVAKATVTTSFMISTKENSLKARQKRARRKTPQQLQAEKTKQQEREKETRRQAAYQRLVARQALQAKKKDTKKTRSAPVASPRASNFVSVTESVCDKTDSVISSSSDESDVSNCSETDEADERAILEMPVVVKVGEDEESEQLIEENEDGTAEDLPDDNGDEEEVERIEDTRSDAPLEVHAPDGQEKDEVIRLRAPEVVDEEHGNQEHVPEESEQLPASEISKSGQDEVVESEEMQEQRVREAIALQLQQFVAERTQFALDHLRKRQIESFHTIAQSLRSESTASRPSTTLSQAPPCISPRIENDSTEPFPVVLESPPRPRTPSAKFVPVLPPSPTKHNLPLPVTSKRPRPTASGTTNQLVPRPIVRDLGDYGSYFANFFCILTSVYEQRMAFTAGSTSASNASIQPTSVSATTAHAGDQALRLQLKLYQSWDTIMNDYATVFGKSLPSPDATSANNTPSTAHYRINSQSRKEVNDIVVTALDKLGDWDEHPSGLGLKTTWNLLWTWSKPAVERKTLLVWQKVNHFQHAKALTRKDCLKKNMAKYHAVGGRLRQAYDIVPASFILPQEYVAFVRAFQERAKHVAPGKNIWIMKPVALSRGRGISLVNALSDVVYGEPVVVQEYIANPLLLDGFKFDLRLYVLVTSFNPLEAFFYEDGFVRMCTRAYEDSDLTNLFIHLTNSSIQKENQDAIASAPENPLHAAHDAEAGGTKMTLAYLWKRLEAMGADVAAVKNDILSVILKALVCGEDHIPYQVNSFDLYGYDILLDTDFRPWLIEINSSPSMARENDLDYQVKDALMVDTLKLVNPLHFDRAKLVDVIARRFHDAETDKKRSHANTRHPKEAEAIATRQLNEDLTEILRGQVPRAYGDMPEHMGNYTRIAPHTTIHNQLMKLKKSCLRLDRK